MVTQVLIDKERVESRCIEACQEHPHHNQQVHLLLLHPLGKVAVVVLETLAIDPVVRLERRVVVANGSTEEFLGAAIHGRHLEALVGNVANRILLLVGSKRENRGNFETFLFLYLTLQFTEGFVIRLGGIHTAHCKHGIEALGPHVGTVGLQGEILEDVA